MKTKLIMAVIAAIILVAFSGCDNERALKPQQNTLPQIAEKCLGTTDQKALEILRKNGFVESEEAQAPKYSWILEISPNPTTSSRTYSVVKYFVRGEKNMPENDYMYNEWITIGLRNDTIYAFRSMLFPNNTSEALSEFRKWSDFAYHTACANPSYWSAHLYYGFEDPRSASLTVDSTRMYINGSRTEYKEALTQIAEEDLKRISDCYLRYNTPKAVKVSYTLYQGMLYITYDSEYTATPFWGAVPLSGDDPGSSTVDPADPNQKPIMERESRHYWKDIKKQEYWRIK